MAYFKTMQEKSKHYTSTELGFSSSILFLFLATFLNIFTKYERELFSSQMK